MKNYLLLLILISLLSCSKSGNRNKHGTTQSNFQNKRTPRDNEFVKNGGYKITIPKNPFVNSEEADENIEFVSLREQKMPKEWA